MRYASRIGQIRYGKAGFICFRKIIILIYKIRIVRENAKNQFLLFSTAAWLEFHSIIVPFGEWEKNPRL